MAHWSPEDPRLPSPPPDVEVEVETAELATVETATAEVGLATEVATGVVDT